LIALDSTTLKLQAVLAGAVATTQPDVHVWFYDVPATKKDSFEDYRPAMKRTATNSTTDVDICSAPSVDNTTRVIQSIAIHNKDTASVTITIKTDDGTTEYTAFKATLATLECATYEDGLGWQCYTVAGARK
jgi:hypothetical protein